VAKVCVPTIGAQGLDARVNPHFGSAPYFTLVDLESGLVEVVANPNQHHERGQCNPTSAITGRGVEAVACGGIGPGAISRLQAEGIRVYLADGSTVKEVVAQFSEGRLRAVTREQACTGHECH
jgi:predicted Fe-Mo cluster-binding NifX family protein